MSDPGLPLTICLRMTSVRKLDEICIYAGHNYTKKNKNKLAIQMTAFPLISPKLITWLEFEIVLLVKYYYITSDTQLKTALDSWCPCWNLFKFKNCSVGIFVKCIDLTEKKEKGKIIYIWKICSWKATDPWVIYHWILWSTSNLLVTLGS